MPTKRYGAENERVKRYFSTRLRWSQIVVISVLLLHPFFTRNGVAYNDYSYMARGAQKADSLFSLGSAFVVSVVFSVVLGATCVKVIRTGDECLIERLGKFHRTIGPGWHLKLPPPIEETCFHQTTREQILDIPPQQCYTLDNAPLRADAVLYMKIVSTQDAYYNVLDVRNAILNLCLTQVREEVGKLTLDESFSSRERLNQALLQDLNSVCRGWGVEITRVEIQNLEPSKDILAAMELQMAAERKKRAAILKSEGEKITLINEAQGRARASVADAEAQKQAQILAAEGEMKRQLLEAQGVEAAMMTLRRALSSSTGERGLDSVEVIRDSLQLLSLIRYLEAQAKFAQSDGTKVLMFPSKDSVPLTYDGIQSIFKM